MKNSSEKNKPLSSFRISRFINEEAYGGVLLIVATIIALIWANSSFHDSYHYIWHEIKFGFVWGDKNVLGLGSLHHLINDGFMAIFFFVIGLEVKREIMGGELSSLKKASMPIAAAIGGMLIPALFYVIVTVSNPDFMVGWGVPMATDIAFALGLLAMLGKRVPLNLKIFLTALAIADDIGAVLVIAIFYTESINYIDLVTAAFFLGVLIIANLRGVRNTVFYGIIGLVGVWIAFVFSGVHATIAGILIALTIPAKTKISENEYMDKLSVYLDKFKKEKSNQKSSLLTSNQAHLISEMESLSDAAHTPLQKLEHALHPIAAYIILPIFALSNAGVHIEGSIVNMLMHPISLGIVAGLVIGKFVGVALFSRLVVKFKLAVLPEGVTWQHVYGVAFLAGIGFTMSIFISDLAFLNEEHKQIAKVGTMAASMLSGIIGMIWLIKTTKKN